MDVRTREILYYKTFEGKEPFSDWINSLSGGNTKRVIKRRLLRLRVGNFGDCRYIGDKVSE